MPPSDVTVPVPVPSATVSVTPAGDVSTPVPRSAPASFGWSMPSRSASPEFPRSKRTHNQRAPKRRATDRRFAILDRLDARNRPSPRMRTVTAARMGRQAWAPSRGIDGPYSGARSLMQSLRRFALVLGVVLLGHGGWRSSLDEGGPSTEDVTTTGGAGTGTQRERGRRAATGPAGRERAPAESGISQGDGRDAWRRRGTRWGGGWCMGAPARARPVRRDAQAAAAGPERPAPPGRTGAAGTLGTGIPVRHADVRRRVHVLRSVGRRDRHVDGARTRARCAWVARATSAAWPGRTRAPTAALAAFSLVGMASACATPAQCMDGVSTVLCRRTPTVPLTVVAPPR